MLDGVADNIASLILSLGRTVAIRTVTDSGEAWDPSRTAADTPAIAAIFDYKAVETDGSIIQADDREAYVSADYELTKQDKIVDGSLVYQIVNLRLLQPGNEKFLYIAQLRK